ncbi:MAG: hypothetical protein ACREMK_01515 [Gemmatimonadota bacterium]
MRIPRTIFALAIGLAGAACSGDEGPTAIEIPIAELRVTGSCGGMVAGSTCPLLAEAKTADGLVVANPVLDWFSNNPTIASVSGNSSSAVVTAHSEGNATVTVSNTSGTVSDDIRVNVLFCSKC